MPDRVTVRFVCGHHWLAPADLHVLDLACPQCRDRRVASVQAPPPRFRAIGCGVTGPHVIQGTAREDV